MTEIVQDSRAALQCSWGKWVCLRSSSMYERALQRIKHVGSPVLSLARKVLGKWRPSGIVSLVEWPSYPKHPCHCESDHSKMPLNGSDTKATRRIRGPTLEGGHSEGGPALVHRECWEGEPGCSFWTALAVEVTVQRSVSLTLWLRPALHAPLSAPPKPFHSVHKEGRRLDGGGIQKQDF